MSNLKEANSCPDGYRALSTGELRELLQNEDKMDQIIRLNEKFQKLQLQRETLLTSNRSLAEESLARRPRLANGKLHLAEKYRQLSDLKTACREKWRELDTHGPKRSLPTAQTLLQEEVARAEEHSESSAHTTSSDHSDTDDEECESELFEKFMEGNVNLEDFLDSFQSARRTHHIRRAQAEKIQEVGRARRQPVEAEPSKEREKVVPEAKDTDMTPEPHLHPNGFVAQGPLRVFQLRYGLTPAILLPHCPVSARTTSALIPQGGASPTLPSESQLPNPGHTHILSPSAPLPGHGQPVGLRVIGQLAGGWPAAGGRPMRVQQLYRPSPQQTEPPYR